MTMLKLSKKIKQTASGAYGKYFKISQNKGIKILRGSFRTLQAAYNSTIFDDAKGEAELMKYSESSGVVPKCYGVRIVKRGSVFRVGILMQHLRGTTLARADIGPCKKKRLVEDLIEQLEINGIAHEDLHDNNIMYFKDRVWAIDFDPSLVYIEEMDAA